MRHPRQHPTAARATPEVDRVSCDAARCRTMRMRRARGDVRTVRYGVGPEQVADLRVPEGAGPHPVAVVLHGGFWLERYRRDLMDGPAADLTARGWATWNVEYRRLGASGGGWPATFEDVAAAVDHLPDVDAPLDLGRVSAVGHSAGGHLAGWLAARTRLAQGTPGLDRGCGWRGSSRSRGCWTSRPRARRRSVAGSSIGCWATQGRRALALASPAALLPLRRADRAGARRPRRRRAAVAVGAVRRGCPRGR